MEKNLDRYILDNFQNAMDYHYIQPYYQPVIRTSSRQLCSFEVLARWMDPEIGMIYPDEFIPVLEENNLIHILDLYIIRQACAKLRMTFAGEGTPVPVSVNLSRKDFDLCDIFIMVDRIVTENRLPRDFINIEITESSVAENKEMMLNEVKKFRSNGYQVWMDDFGSAYSSLNTLKDFEFDEIKLDMGFLRPFTQRSQRIAASKYYDDIGKVNLLSAVPFMTKEERDSITTARQLNSIPLALAEVRKDYFSILFYNTAFEETALETGMFADIFSQEQLRKPQPFNVLSDRIISLMDSTVGGEEGRMLFSAHDEYYEVQAKCVAKTSDKYSVLIRMSNLSKTARTANTSLLDDSLVRIYSMFERITLVDLNEDTIRPLYTTTREDLVSQNTGALSMAQEYAEKYVYPEDREAYLRAWRRNTPKNMFTPRTGTHTCAWWIRARSKRDSARRESIS